MLSVRPAEAHDEDAVVALWHECELVASYNDPVADFRFAKAGACSDVLVATFEAGVVATSEAGVVAGSEAGVVAGSVSGVVAGSVMVGHDGHRGWLYYVAASPACRGEGVGRVIVQAGEDWLRQRGILKVQLLVRDTNTGVVGFYEHLGFEVARRVVMSKWLDPSDKNIQ